MTKEMYKAIENIVNKIDEKREKLKEEFKKSYQYKKERKYKIADQHYLNILLERRNTLVSVLNYNYTGDIKCLEELVDD
jgi:hypothetical protein